MPDQTALDAVLAQACDFARDHGVTPTIAPSEFGIRHHDGLLTATYADSDHIVVAFIDHRGESHLSVGEVYWLHAAEDGESCETCDPAAYAGRPMQTVYLPGDGPQAVSADV